MIIFLKRLLYDLKSIFYENNIYTTILYITSWGHEGLGALII